MAMIASPIELDRYVVDTLMADLVGHDHHPSAFLVYMALVSATWSGFADLSYAQLAERTGLSKRSVQTAVARLQKRELIAVYGATPTEPRRYRLLEPWKARPGARPARLYPRKISYHNHSSGPREVAIEPWGLAHTVGRGGKLDVAYAEQDNVSVIDIDVSDDGWTTLSVYGDQPTVTLDGETVWPER